MLSFHPIPSMAQPSSYLQAHWHVQNWMGNLTQSKRVYKLNVWSAKCVVLLIGVGCVWLRSQWPLYILKARNLVQFIPIQYCFLSSNPKYIAHPIFLNNRYSTLQKTIILCLLTLLWDLFLILIINFPLTSLILLLFNKLPCCTWEN